MIKSHHRLMVAYFHNNIKFFKVNKFIFERLRHRTSRINWTIYGSVRAQFVGWSHVELNNKIITIDHIKSGKRLLHIDLWSFSYRMLRTIVYFQWNLSNIQMCCWSEKKNSHTFDEFLNMNKNTHANWRMFKLCVNYLINQKQLLDVYLYQASIWIYKRLTLAIGDLSVLLRRWVVKHRFLKCFTRLSFVC